MRPFHVSLFFVAFCASLLPACTGDPTAEALATSESSQSAPASVLVPVPVMLNWPIAQTVLDQGPGLQQAVAGWRLAEWDRFTPDYFAELKARKDAVIAWARTTHPLIVFIGEVQVAPVGYTSDAHRRAVVDVQSWVFERAKEEAMNASIISVEQYGTDGQLTVDAYVAVMKSMFADYAPPGGRMPTDEQIREMAASDFTAGARAIHTLNVPVYCGEEWPIQLEFKLRRLSAGPMSDDAQALLGRFVVDVNRLRSEITLIRALENLRKVGGTKAIILMGNDHGDDIQEVAGEYAINYTFISPLPPVAQQ